MKYKHCSDMHMTMFSSPFSGTFLQFDAMRKQLDAIMALFSSPFSGTFLQCEYMGRPTPRVDEVFVPFLGDLFAMSILSKSTYG